jgi:hypothetical protein
VHVHLIPPQPTTMSDTTNHQRITALEAENAALKARIAELEARLQLNSAPPQSLTQTTPTATPELSAEEYLRYGRQLIMPQIGLSGTHFPAPILPTSAPVHSPLLPTSANPVPPHRPTKIKESPRPHHRRRRPRLPRRLLPLLRRCWNSGSPRPRPSRTLQPAPPNPPHAPLSGAS